MNWKYDAPHRNMTYGVITPPGQTMAWNYWILALHGFVAGSVVVLAGNFQ